jgi:hypothetical protein
MKIVIVLGSGNSGAGAIYDYLRSRTDFQAPFYGKEFRIVNDPNGLDQLYHSLYKNFSINGSSNSIEEFKKFIVNTYHSNYNKNLYLNKNLIKFSNLFIKRISKTTYNGCPRFYLDKLTLIKKINFYLKRFIFMKNAKEIPMLQMTIPCEEKKFLEYAEEYFFSIFRSYKNFNEKKNIVIEQGGNFINPLDSTKYYGKNRKIIIVNRDPKAIFWSMKRRNSLSYPGDDVKKFVIWYKELLKKVINIKSENIIKIKFENFFENFNIEKIKLSKNLGISTMCKDNFDINHTLKNLYKFKDNLSKDEIKYLDDNLGE